jgi:hypothetical protein
VIAFGFLYFAAVGLSELFAHRGLPVSGAAGSGLAAVRDAARRSAARRPRLAAPPAGHERRIGVASRGCRGLGRVLASPNAATD